MKNASMYARRWAALLRRIRSQHPFEPPQPAEPLAQLVLAFLEWNATQAEAAAAQQRLLAAMVDYNDLRVSHPFEVARVLGEDYPQAMERAERLHETLQDIYLRQQAVSLGDLAARPKREIREYLDTLHGAPPYAAAQVALLCFAVHAIPVDDRLARMLAEAQAVDPDATCAEIESFLQRQVKVEKALETHAALRAWEDAEARRGAADDAPRGGASQGGPRRPPAAGGGAADRTRDRNPTRR